MSDDLATRIEFLLAAEQEVIAPLARLHRRLARDPAASADADRPALCYARLRWRERPVIPWLRVAEPEVAPWQPVPCPEPVRREYERAFRSLGDLPAPPAREATSAEEPPLHAGTDAPGRAGGVAEQGARAGVDALTAVLASSVSALFQRTEAGMPGVFVLTEVVREAETVGSVLHATAAPPATRA
jgi:hypothetical protein